LGLNHHELGNYQKALDAFDQVLKHWPKYPTVYGNRGDTLAKLKRLDESAEAYGNALQFDNDLSAIARKPPEDIRAEACLGLGAVRVRQGKWQEALDALRLAEKFEQPFIAKGYQAYPEIPYYIGLALDELGHRDEAMRAYQESLRLNPHSISARGN